MIKSSVGIALLDIFPLYPEILLDINMYDTWH